MQDHSEFIARHHRPQLALLDKDGVNPRRLSAVVALVAAYVAVCGGLVYFLHIDRSAVIAAAVALVSAALTAMLILYLIKIHSVQGRERQILREVMEGSRGARFITDGADNIVFANRRFRKLCEGLGEPSLVTVARMFEQDAGALAHFGLLADQAQQGQTDSIELLSLRQGRELWYQVTAQPVSNWAGTIHWRIDDITHRRETDPRRAGGTGEADRFHRQRAGRILLGRSGGALHFRQRHSRPLAGRGYRHAAGRNAAAHVFPGPARQCQGVRHRLQRRGEADGRGGDEGAGGPHLHGVDQPGRRERGAWRRPHPRRGPRPDRRTGDAAGAEGVRGPLPAFLRGRAAGRRPAERIRRAG